MEQQDSESTPRIVLLGASNLTRGISTIVETAHHLWGPRLEILVASGHGRSYGLKSVFLGRALPAIIHCGLWEALAERRNVPTVAMITDIGNDILFNASVSQIVSWIEIVLDRLEQANAQICMTLLPVASAATVGPRRFHFFRRLYVPGCPLDLAEVLKRACELSERLERLGKARNVRIVEQRGEWYGIDPIHIRLRHWRAAWPEILSAELANRGVSPPRIQGSLARWLYLRSRRPHYRWWWGREQRAPQPACKLESGTTISFY